MPHEQELLLKPKRVAAMCNISYNHLLDLHKSGQFPKGIYLGHALRFSMKSIEQFIEENISGSQDKGGSDDK